MKKEIHFNESKYNSFLSAMNRTADQLGDIVDKFNALGIDTISKDEELEQLINDVEGYFLDSLIKGINIESSTLKLSKHKLAELVEKPSNYDALLQSVKTQIADIKGRSKNQDIPFKSNHFGFDKQGKVFFKDCGCKEHKELCTIYVTNKKQEKVHNVLKTLVGCLNELRILKGGYLPLKELKNALENTNDANIDFKINPSYITSIK